MLKIRLMGTKNDIKWFERILKRQPKVAVTEFSELYRNKGTNRFYRAMGSKAGMGEEFEAKVWEKRMPDLTPAEQLAVEVDRFSYDYDTILYHDSTRNMTENMSELAESINQGDISHLTTWLADVVIEGTEPEETRRAAELLEKLAEYKPLAKIEEMEEQNYNMVDDVLNNGAGEKAQKGARL